MNTLLQHKALTMSILQSSTMRYCLITSIVIVASCNAGEDVSFQPKNQPKKLRCASRPASPPAKLMDLGAKSGSSSPIPAWLFQQPASPGTEPLVMPGGYISPAPMTCASSTTATPTPKQSPERLSLKGYAISDADMLLHLQIELQHTPHSAYDPHDPRSRAEQAQEQAKKQENVRRAIKGLMLYSAMSRGGHLGQCNKSFDQHHRKIMPKINEVFAKLDPSVPPFTIKPSSIDLRLP